MKLPETSNLQVKFLTKQEQYSVADSPFVVDLNVTTKELNSLLNQLLQESGKYEGGEVEFDFLAAGQFIRTPLGEHVLSRGLSTEDVIDVEYVERLPAPVPQDVLLHDEWVAAVHSSDKFIITGCFDNSVQMWTTSSNHVLSISKHTKAVKAVAWIHTSEDDTSFISASHDASVLFWKLNNNDSTVECVCNYSGHKNGIECVGVSKNGEMFASGGWDCQVKLWSTSLEGVQYVNNEEENQEKPVPIKEPKLSLTDHREAIFDITWFDSNDFATCSWDHTIRVWDSNVGNCVLEIGGNKAYCSLHASPFNRQLISSSADPHIRLYDIRSPEFAACKMTFTSHKNWVTSVRWSPTVDHLFISGAYDNMVKMWDLRSPRAPLYDLTGHEDRVLCTDWTVPNLAVSGGCDNTLRLFNTP